MTNDAHGKQPTIAEEMSKFTGFSVTNGETSDGKPTAEENARLALNSNTHAENVAGEKPAPKTEEKPTAGAKEEKPAAKAVQLTEAEETAAVVEAAKKAGVDPKDLDEAAADAAVATALEAKNRTEAAAIRKAAKAEEFRANRRARLVAETENAKKDARIERLEADIAALKAGKQPTSLTAAAKDDKNQTPGKPDATDTKYEYGVLDPQYLADLTRWTTLEAIRESKESEKTSASSAADTAAQEAFDEAVEKFDQAGLERFEDFDTVVIESRSLPKDDPAYWPLSQTMAELVLESDHGPAIAYALASDPKEARRIEKLSPARQAAWFGVKEAELITAGSGEGEESGNGTGQPAGGQKQPKAQAQESKAPIPLPSHRKLNGHGGNRVPSSATTDFAAFEAQHNGSQRRN